MLGEIITVFPWVWVDPKLSKRSSMLLYRAQLRARNWNICVPRTHSALKEDMS